jgi:hypothetical protein
MSAQRSQTGGEAAFRGLNLRSIRNLAGKGANYKNFMRALRLYRAIVTHTSKVSRLAEVAEYEGGCLRPPTEIAGFVNLHLLNMNS